MSVYSETPPNDPVALAVDDLFGGRHARASDLPRRAIALERELKDRVPGIHVDGRDKGSFSPGKIALSVLEPLERSEERTVVTALSHTVVLAPKVTSVVKGFLPGGTSGHLFDRIEQRAPLRDSRGRILLELSQLWPMLLLMRARQRVDGRGEPIGAIASPYGGGLLLATLQKVHGLPGSGLYVDTRSREGWQRAYLHDWFDNGRNERLWVETRTFVSADLLSCRQQVVRDDLLEFLHRFDDVVKAAVWWWRIGDEQGNPAVSFVRKSKGLRCTRARWEEGLDALEAILSTDEWMKEAEQNEKNQSKSRKGRRKSTRR